MIIFAAVIAVVLVARSTSHTVDASTAQSSDTLREFGRYLFYDPTLSVDSSTSCGTCHQHYAAHLYADKQITIPRILEALAAFTGSIVSRSSRYDAMRDGRYRRLRDVLEFFSTPSMHASYADARIRTIGSLNDAQRKDITAFLSTLTDTVLPRDPRYRDPHLP